tara:strand:- start:176 stop:2122 length:1947 start_codon:yes stop_codon:yes gene_type:complete
MPDPAPLDEIDLDAITDMAEKAKIIAEATDRKESDVLADLLDDGIANFSAGSDMKVDEKDFLDKAQEQAEKLKKLLTTLIPIVALLAGVGAEGLGILDITGWGEESIWDEDNPNPNVTMWGCTAPDADNYDPMANTDDGSCYWDDNNGGGGGPPANCQWEWEDNSFMDNGNFLVIRATFGDDSCPHEMEGRFTVELHKDNQFYDEDEWENIRFKHNYEIQHQWGDLEPGVYRNHFTFETYDGSNWNWDSPETHEVFDDTCYPQTELDDPTLSSDGNDLIVDLIFSDMNGCGQDIEIEIEVWNWGELHDTLEYGEVHSGVFWIEPDGDSTMRVQGKAELSDVPDGDNWFVKVRYAHANADDSPYESDWQDSNTIVIDEVPDPVYGCMDSEADNYNPEATVDDDSCEYPPDEPCDVEIINHYRGHVAEDAEQDAILVAFRVVPNDYCDEGVEIDLWLKQPGQAVNYSHSFELDDPSQAEDFSHTFDGIAVGNSWTPVVTAYDMENDSIVEQIFMWGIDVEEQEPETCEINLYDIALVVETVNNSTTATIAYDLDCGEESNNLPGYNVSVQFLIYEVGETNSGPNATGPVNWTTTVHYIQGYIDDTNQLSLGNFTGSNASSYDFYFYAIWEDADGNTQYIERTWLEKDCFE